MDHWHNAEKALLSTTVFTWNEESTLLSNDSLSFV